MREIVRLNVGARYAYLHVLRQVTDSALQDMRSYEVRADCCGDISVRSERAIRDAVRKGRACCQICIWKERKIVQAPMQRVGPILVMRPGSTPDSWLVRWDCCGREMEISETRVRQIRNLTRKGQPTQCRQCRGDSLVGVPNALRTTRVIEDDDDDLPTLHSGVGYLPEGLISAALAWPRPRLLMGEAR